MKRRINIFIVFCLAGFLALALIPSRPDAQVYRWVDRQGNVHFTDDMSQVPPEHRKAASERPDSSSDPTKPGVNQIPSSSNPKDSLDEEEDTPTLKTSPAPNEKSQKEYWQNRMSKAKQDLDKAKSELEGNLTESRQNLESGPGMQQRQADLTQKRSDLEAKIKQLEYDVNQGIADEARKEGVPPGWLR